MKYSFDEKKKAAGAFATLMFVCAAGVIWLMSGHARSDSGAASGTKHFISAVRAQTDDSGGKEIPQDEADNTDDMYNTHSTDSAENMHNTGNADNMNEEDMRTVTVHVCGAVNNPGVYELDAHARVDDAVNIAGGFKDNAAKDYLNLAENISDGQKIVIYTKKQVKSLGAGKPDGGDGNSGDNGGGIYSDSVSHGLVNINTASKEELMTLQGIGESKADDIIAYRESNGRFKNTDELMNIPGIKEGVYSKISDNITV